MSRRRLLLLLQLLTPSILLWAESDRRRCLKVLELRDRNEQMRLAAERRHLHVASSPTEPLGFGPLIPL